MTPNWRQLAAGMLEIERKMRPLHRPPSVGCLVTWRDRTLVGMIQSPVSARFPAIVFLSVTSKYFDPEFVRAVRNLDPGRLELEADPALDLNGNFHTLHRDGKRLTFMPEEETAEMLKNPMEVIEAQPHANGEVVEFKSAKTITVLKPPPKVN